MAAAPLRVLVVDDEASFRTLVCQVLCDKGFEAVGAESSAQALAEAEKGAFSAAVIDMVMPDGDGIALAERIKAGSPETEILILTGHADLDSVIKSIRHGVFDYLEKSSVDLTRLEHTVREAAGKSQLVRENRELIRQLQESNGLLKALHEMGTSLAGEQHLDRVLEKLVISAKELCKAECGRALLFGVVPGGKLVIEVSAGDGAEALRGLRVDAQEGLTTVALELESPVMLASASGDPRYSARCDGMPTTLPGFLCAPLRQGEVKGTVAVAGRAGGFAPVHGELLHILASQAAIGIDNAIYHERSINFFTHASEILVSFLEKMDIYYPGHSRGVAALCDMISRRLGATDEERRDIHFAALLHDIGKMMVDPDILNTNKPLTEEGRVQLQDHTRLGVELLKGITLWTGILPIILSHHERWDGGGYPRGLAGEDIPLGGRVVAVADSFDAMTRPTPHGPYRSPEEGISELEKFAGSQFDPRIVRLFVTEYRLRREQIPL